MAMNQSCYAIITKQTGHEYFINQLSIYTVQSIKQKSNGAVFDAINAKDITEEQVPLISEQSIDNYEKSVSPLYEQMWKNGLEIQSLTTLRDLLLPKMMTGEIDISSIGLPTKYSFDWPLSYVFLMRVLYILLINHGIMERRIYPHMT